LFLFLFEFFLFLRGKTPMDGWTRTNTEKHGRDKAGDK